MKDIYTDLDKLDKSQDLLLALAVYDWYFFNDMRIYRLMKEFEVNNKTKEVFTYYYGKSQLSIESNSKRYTQQYKHFLQNIVASV